VTGFHRYALADLQAYDTLTQRGDFAGELVPTQMRQLNVGTLQVIAIEVEITTTDAGGPDAYQNLTRACNRVGHLLHADVVHAIEQCGFHGATSTGKRE
jgi:hypothetical protein